MVDGEALTAEEYEDLSRRRKNERIRRWGFYIWLIIFTVVVGWQVQDNRNQIEDLKRTEAALCSFKTELSNRVVGARKFLDSHPSGIPGLPANIIRDNIVNQQKTLDSLSALHCNNNA